MTETAPPTQPTEKLPPGLYIVATPIGNLGDITMRAQDVLARCDGIACEDTRVTGKLMKHLGLSKQLWRYDDHSGEKDRIRLVESMQSRSVALVSDAGTPLIADPGYRLVQDTRAADIKVTSIPGPNAITTALTLSGLPNDRFLFAGFLPAKEKARREVLLELATVRTTLIFYETGPRLTKSLTAIKEILGGRKVSVARELTKLFEECRTGTADELNQHYTEHPPKGEIVLLIGPPEDVEISAEDADDMLRNALKTNKASQAAGEVARATGLDRKALYARALALRDE